MNGWIVSAACRAHLGMQWVIFHTHSSPRARNTQKTLLSHKMGKFDALPSNLLVWLCRNSDEPMGEVVMARRIMEMEGLPVVTIHKHQWFNTADRSALLLDLFRAHLAPGVVAQQTVAESISAGMRKMGQLDGAATSASAPDGAPAREINSSAQDAWDSKVPGGSDVSAGMPGAAPAPGGASSAL